MDPFTTLGLAPSFELDRRALEGRFRELQKQLHPDRHASAPASHRRMNLAKAVEVNEAYRTLKSEIPRAEALLAALGHDAAPAAAPADPEFLVEVMELREALGDAKAGGDMDAVAGLSDRVVKMQTQTRADLRDAFERIANESGAAEGGRALIARMRYFKRFLDEVAVIEEEAEE